MFAPNHLLQTYLEVPLPIVLLLVPNFSIFGLCSVALSHTLFGLLGLLGRANNVFPEIIVVKMLISCSNNSSSSLVCLQNILKKLYETTFYFTFFEAFITLGYCFYFLSQLLSMLKLFIPGRTLSWRTPVIESAGALRRSSCQCVE